MPADIAIVGGGPAGLSLAALLERHGYDYVVYERSRENVPPRGGSLDLHSDAGQRVMREAGLEKEFEANSRRGAATEHRVFNHKLEPLLSWGEGRNAPEIDRGVLRNVLFGATKPGRVIYDKNLSEAVRDEEGRIVLRFTDGTEASGFKLVVGADGVFSKVRPLVTTSANPIFLNQLYFSFRMFDTNPRFKNNLEMAKEGPMVIMGKNTHVWNMMQGDGHFQVDFGISGVGPVQEADKLDWSDVAAVKKFLLQDKYFGQYDPWVHDLIEAVEPFPDQRVHRWNLNIMPADLMDWEPCKDVTLIGDSAHATTPYVGEGVNCAMRDTCLLLEQLEKHGINGEAVAAYEEQMMPLGRDLVRRSLRSGATFYNVDAGESFKRLMKSPKQRLFGRTDKTFSVGEVSG